MGGWNSGGINDIDLGGCRVQTYPINRQRALTLLLLSSVLLLTLDLTGIPFVNRARSAFSVVLSPFDTAGRAAINPVRNLWHATQDYDELNRKYQSALDELASQKGAVLAARGAYGEHQELLAMDGITVRYPTMTARVVGGSPGNFQQTIEIDRGSDDTIVAGMPVINAAGLIGKVTAVYPNRSVILLVSDPSYAIECTVSASQPDLPTGAGATSAGDRALLAKETGACKGRAAGRLPAMTYVVEDRSSGPIRTGDVITTSGGFNSLAPPGLVVGEVVNKVSAGGSSGELLEIDPAADLDQLHLVQVVLFRPLSEVPG